MSVLDKIKQNIISEVNKVIGKDVVGKNDLSYPPKPGMGDLCLACFNQSKLGFSASELYDKLLATANKGWSLNLTGAYLNFTLDKKVLAGNVIKEIEKEKNNYGTNNFGKKKKVMVEFSNVNTHKEFHIGHLRNICYGDALQRILAANGYTSMPVSYVNDFGIHVAKTLWAYLTFYKDRPLPENKGYFLGKVYVHASEEIAKKAMNKELVNFMMKKIESRQGDDYKLWQKTRKWSIDGFAKIYKELGVKFDYTFYESQYADAGRNIVADLYEKHILKKSEGAIIADLENEKLGILVIIRADGTMLYPVADLALAEEKFKKYKIDKSIYIVDKRQALYFKQLFRLLEKIGYNKEMVHIGYEVVKLPTGMMSSRLGNVITYEDLRQEVYGKAFHETRTRHVDWSEKKIHDTAAVIANGALKFEMIKVNADQVITFDIARALSFEGFTAAYLQYTYARINSIEKKVNARRVKADSKLLNDPKEEILILNLAKYPETISRAGANCDPSEIAKYLLSLSQSFNDYYHAVPILKAEKDMMMARLSLIAAVKQTIKNGLNLLGIDIVNEM